MKNKDNRLFDFLNWILKTNQNKPKDYQPPMFLINRWISMTNPQFALILNSTGNRWLKNIKEFDFGNFYYHIFPKYGKRIEYLKKKSKDSEENIEDVKNLAERMECSIREIEIYEKTLEELNKTNN